MILTVIFWNTLRCSTTNRNRNLDCCCPGVNGSPAGKKAKRNLTNKETSRGQVPISRKIGEVHLSQIGSEWGLSSSSEPRTRATLSNCSMHCCVSDVQSFLHREARGPP